MHRARSSCYSKNSSGRETSSQRLTRRATRRRLPKPTLGWTSWLNVPVSITRTRWRNSRSWTNSWWEIVDSPFSIRTRFEWILHHRDQGRLDWRPLCPFMMNKKPETRTKTTTGKTNGGNALKSSIWFRCARGVKGELVFHEQVCVKEKPVNLNDHVCPVRIWESSQECVTLVRIED